MHLGNQSHELVGPDLVMPHVAADDARDPIRIDLPRRILFCHVSALLLILAVDETAIETINYYVMHVFHQHYFGIFQNHCLCITSLEPRSASPTARPANSRISITAAWSR
jgi:hypothetical protein